MYATVRRYAGKGTLADELAAQQDEILPLVSAVPGFRAYYLIRAGNDTVSVTVYDDESGAQRSNEVAREWLRENMSGSGSAEVSAGEVVVSKTA